MFWEEIKVIQSSTSLDDIAWTCSVVNSAETSPNDLRSAHVGIHDVSQKIYIIDAYIINNIVGANCYFNGKYDKTSLIFTLTSFASFNFSPII